jgi:lipoate---protein ligase
LKSMHFLDLTLASLTENLALDEALLLEAEAGEGGEILRLWEWPAPAVVLGAGCRLAEDVDETACAADGVPIARRASGGGTVLLGAGCLNYTLVLSYDRSPALREIPFSYDYILGRIGNALRELVPGIERAGTSDLAAGGRKFSGNAQQRKRGHLLHHGTLLGAFDIEQVARYLRLPERRPDYRRDRSHADFLMKLAIDGRELKQRLRVAWHADTESVAWPQILVHRLDQDKYRNAEWTRRR